MASVCQTETNMGTYTTNYNLFMPTVGETGWGELVNSNFSTIDTTLKGLSNRITAVENEVNGALSCTSVTTSGKVTANGGLSSTTGTFSGAVTGKTFNGIVLKNSGTYTVTPTSTYIKLINSGADVSNEDTLTVLSFMPNVTYNGSLIFKTTTATWVTNLYYTTDKLYDWAQIVINSNTSKVENATTTINFTNVKYLKVSASNGAYVPTNLFVSDYKLS